MCPAGRGGSGAGLKETRLHTRNGWLNPGGRVVTAMPVRGKGDALRLMTNEGDIKQGQKKGGGGTVGGLLAKQQRQFQKGERGGGPPSMAKRGKMEREGKQLCVNGWNNGTGRVGEKGRHVYVSSSCH